MTNNQALANIQSAMTLGNVSDELLGGLVIISALITEFALTEILFAVADKIETVVNRPGVSIEELAEIDNSVASVLEQVCYIERQVTGKIREGRRLRNGYEPE